MYQHRPVALTLLAAVIVTALAHAQDVELPPLAPTPAAATNLLTNPGFEDPDAPGWAFTDWPPREDTGAALIADSIRYTDEQAYEGGRCLVLDLTTVGTDRTLISQQRLSAEALAPLDGATMRMSAQVLLGGGPTVHEVNMTMRQWGEDGLLTHQSLRLNADVNEWTSVSKQFTFRMGATTRADFKVSARQTPELADSPVVYVDDVRLEVLAPPPLAAELPWGETLMAPDNVLPVAVHISEEAWAEGLRGLRWDITAPDGIRSLAHGEMAAPTRDPVLSVTVPDLTEGSYALRLALGAEPGQRSRELLLPFTRAEGPLAH